ncbi:MAG: 2-oxoacid:acceptor oxidoreductase subunit alpha [Candidatus Cloacimonetes bacterium]|nr:2-oxoacid:acceptor oxidoreductase subunit alpha [Candidatus Cloacimonadota bacterium]
MTKKEEKMNVPTEKNEPHTQLLQGNEAVALGALAAGVNFFGGYPITPSTEVAEYLSEELPKVGGKYIMLEDEIAGMCSVIGASLAGAKAMTATSGPGFSLMQEAIGYAKQAEVPCVVVNVMRSGPSTGLPTKPSQGDIQQARWGSHGDAPAIVLYPHTVREAFDLTVRAFNLSEKYRTCVTLLLDEVLGHMREAVVLPDPSTLRIINRLKPSVPPEWYKHYEENQKYPTPLASYGEGYRFHVTGLAHDSLGFPTNKSSEVAVMMNRLKKKIIHNIRDLVQIETFKMDNAKIAVFAAGICARSAKSAVNQARFDGIPVGLLRPLTIWPFPDDAAKKMLRDVDVVIVPELNEGQMCREIERLKMDPKSKLISLTKVDGEIITPAEILRVIREVN